MDDFKIQAGVFMNGHVAETHHPLHSNCELCWKDASSLEEGKCITAILRHAKLPLTHHVHGQIDGRFTGALKIEDDGILLSLIGDKVLFVSCVFLLDGPKATLDAGGLVQDHVVSHTPARAS